MTCLLNEEIRSIKNTMSCLENAISLESDIGEKERLKQKHTELDKLLQNKLNECGDYKW